VAISGCSLKTPRDHGWTCRIRVRSLAGQTAARLCPASQALVAQRFLSTVFTGTHVISPKNGNFPRGRWLVMQRCGCGEFSSKIYHAQLPCRSRPHHPSHSPETRRIQICQDPSQYIDLYKPRRRTAAELELPLSRQLYLRDIQARQPTACPRNSGS
jgi:hypothetical protein